MSWLNLISLVIAGALGLLAGLPSVQGWQRFALWSLTIVFVIVSFSIYQADRNRDAAAESARQAESSAALAAAVQRQTELLDQFSRVFTPLREMTGSVTCSVPVDQPGLAPYRDRIRQYLDSNRDPLNVPLPDDSEGEAVARQMVRQSSEVTLFFFERGFPPINGHVAARFNTDDPSLVFRQRVEWDGSADAFLIVTDFRRFWIRERLPSVASFSDLLNGREWTAAVWRRTSSGQNALRGTVTRVNLQCDGINADMVANHAWFEERGNTVLCYGDGMSPAPPGPSGSGIMPRHNPSMVGTPMDPGH